MEVGQKVYLKDLYSNKEPQEYEIVRVGRVYFYASRGPTSREYKIKIDNLVCVDYRSFKVYLLIQDYLDEQEFYSLHLEIENAFRYGNKKQFTLDQLRQIKRIIDGGEEVE